MRPFGTPSNAFRSSGLGRIAVLLVFRFQASSVTCEKQVEARGIRKQLFEPTVSHFRGVSGFTRKSLKFKNVHLVEARCSFCKKCVRARNAHKRRCLQKRASGLDRRVLCDFQCRILKRILLNFKICAMPTKSVGTPCVC